MPYASTGCVRAGEGTFCCGRPCRSGDLTLRTTRPLAQSSRGHVWITVKQTCSSQSHLTGRKGKEYCWSRGLDRPAGVQATGTSGQWAVAPCPRVRLPARELFRAGRVWVPVGAFLLCCLCVDASVRVHAVSGVRGGARRGAWSNRCCCLRGCSGFAP